MESVGFRFLLFFAVLAAVLPGMVSADSNTSSQALYVEASLYAGKAIEEDGSYSDALLYYKEAQERIDSIMKNKSSQTAIGLASGSLALDGITLHKFLEKSSMLVRLAEAENDLLKAALQVASTIEDKESRERSIFEIYIEHLDDGGREHVERHLSETNSPDDKMWGIMVLLEYYARLGNNNEVKKLLAQALVLAEDPEFGLGSDYQYRHIVTDAAPALEGLVEDQEIFRLLTEAISYIEDSDHKANAMIALGRLKASHNETQLALAIIDDANEVAEYNHPGREKGHFGDDHTITALLDAYLFVNATEMAYRLIPFLSENKLKSEAYLIIVDHYIRQGDIEKANASLIKSLEFARAVLKDRVGFLGPIDISEVAMRYASLGQVETAISLHKEIRLEAIKSDAWREWYYPFYLAEMIHNFMYSSSTDEAKRFYSELFTVTHGYGHFSSPGKGTSYEVMSLRIAAEAFAGPQTLDYARRALTHSLLFMEQLDSAWRESHYLSELSLTIKRSPDLNLRERDWKVVRNIVHATQPIETVWE